MPVRFIYCIWETVRKKLKFLAQKILKFLNADKEIAMDYNEAARYMALPSTVIYLACLRYTNNVSSQLCIKMDALCIVKANIPCVMFFFLQIMGN